MKILKITEGFVTNSSSYSGYVVIATRKGKDLKPLLDRLGLGDFVSRFEGLHSEFHNDIEYEDLLDEYDLLEARVLLGAYGDVWLQGAAEGKDLRNGEDNELRSFIEEFDGTNERLELVGDDLILLFGMCYY